MFNLTVLALNPALDVNPVLAPLDEQAIRLIDLHAFNVTRKLTFGAIIGFKFDMNSEITLDAPSVVAYVGDQNSKVTRSIFEITLVRISQDEKLDKANFEISPFVDPATSKRFFDAFQSGVERAVAAINLETKDPEHLG